MKNIKNVILDESIIGNTAGIGIKQRVEEWGGKAFFSTSNFTINDDNSVDIHFKNALLNREFAVVPTRINDCNELEVESDVVKKFILPRSANKVTIHDCKNLEILQIDEDTTCGYLTISNCPNLNFTKETEGLLKSHVKRLIIERCGITTIYCIGNVDNVVTISNCPKLKSFDADQLCTNYFDLSDTHIRSICVNTQTKNFNVHECDILKDINISNADRDFEFLVDKCSRLETVIIANPANSVTISKCNNIKNISVQNCSNMLCITDVDAEYDLPKTISGICVFKNCKNAPTDIKCKKLVVKG